MSESDWNHRPIEDQIKAELREMCEKNTKARKIVDFLLDVVRNAQREEMTEEAWNALYIPTDVIHFSASGRKATALMAKYGWDK
jgi:lysophospholipase L1-like esterase